MSTRLERHLYVKLKDWMSNSVDQDEIEPYNLDICFCKSLLLSPVAVKEIMISGFLKKNISDTDIYLAETRLFGPEKSDA